MMKKVRGRDLLHVRPFKALRDNRLLAEKEMKERKKKQVAFALPPGRYASLDWLDAVLSRKHSLK